MLSDSRKRFLGGLTDHLKMWVYRDKEKLRTKFAHRRKRHRARKAQKVTWLEHISKMDITLFIH